MLVVDPQNRFQIGQQVALGQKLTDDLTDQRGAAQARRPPAPETRFRPAHCGSGSGRCRAPERRRGRDCASDGDLELARQVGKFRVEGGPLADDFAVNTRVFDSSGATPANGQQSRCGCSCRWSGWRASPPCASSARMSGVSSSFGQLY
jgi:hypothetical protein